MSVIELTNLRPPELLTTYKLDGRPWLICGMGPSFSRYKEVDLSKYNVLGINRVVSLIPVDLCSIIDFYIIDKVKDSILEQAKYLVIPYYPHFMCRPHLNLSIMNLILQSKLLRQMLREERLLSYNLITCPIKSSEAPFVRAKFFSAEAAFSMLGHLGVKEIYTLGVDGGSIRSELFKDHGPTDPRGFDLQWEGINRTVEHFGIHYEPLFR